LDSGASLPEFQRRLAPKAFYTLAHQLIYTAMLDTLAEKGTMDEVLLYHCLKKNGTMHPSIEALGGELYLCTLMESVPTGANLDYWADIVRELAAKRALIQSTYRAQDRLSTGENITDIAADIITAASTVDAPPTISLPWCDAGALMQNPMPPPPPLVATLLYPATLAILGGAPKVGKSFFGLEIGLAVATGSLALGELRTQRGRVLYIALEDTRDEIGRRLATLSAGRMPQPESFSILAGRPFDLLCAADREALIERGSGCHLIEIDSLRRAHRISEDSSEDAARVGAALREIVTLTGATVLTFHHFTKAGDPEADPFTRLRGSGDLFADPDTAILFERRRGEDWVGVQTVHRIAPEPQSWCFRRIHDDSGEIRWMLRRENILTVRTEVRQCNLVEEISRVVRSHPGVSVRGVRDACGGSHRAKDQALRALIDEGLVRADPGKDGKTREHFWVADMVTVPDDTMDAAGQSTQSTTVP